jgi:hypothetical protein
MPLPCVVHGLWLEQTGTVLLEAVWCDGAMYYPAQLTAEEIVKFSEELAESVLHAEF